MKTDSKIYYAFFKISKKKQIKKDKNKNKKPENVYCFLSPYIFVFLILLRFGYYTFFDVIQVLILYHK